MPHSSPIPLRLRRPSQAVDQASQLSPSLPPPRSTSQEPTTTLNIQNLVLGTTILTPTVEGEFPSSLVHPLDGSTTHEHDASGEHREAKARAEWLFVCEKCCRYEVRPEVYWAHVRFCPGWGEEECEEPREERRRGKRRYSGEEEEQGEEGPGHPTERRLVFKGRGGEEVYEVDGKKEKLFCQCLSALASCFISSKSVSFDVEAFLFYVLYIPIPTSSPPSDSEDTSSTSSRKKHRAAASKPRTRTTITLAPKQKQQMKLAGYFSKEKKSWDEFNLACILVFPQYQSLGLGRLLVELSYEFTLRAYNAARAAHLAAQAERGSSREGSLDSIHTPLTGSGSTIAPTVPPQRNSTILTPTHPWGTPEKPLSASAERMYRSFWHSRISEYLHELLPPSHNPRKLPTPTITVRAICEATGIAPEDVIAVLREWDAVLKEKGEEDEVVNLVVEKIPPKVVPMVGKRKRWGVGEGWIAEPIIKTADAEA